MTTDVNDVLVTIKVGGLNYTVPAGGEAERQFREMAAPEPADMAGPEYRDIETQAESRSGAIVVWIVAGVLFWLVVGLVWTWLT